MKKRRRTRTSQFRGVTRSGAKWRAAIRINNIKRELGVFESEAEAARYVSTHHCTLTSNLHGRILRSKLGDKRPESSPMHCCGCVCNGDSEGGRHLDMYLTLRCLQ